MSGAGARARRRLRAVLGPLVAIVLGCREDRGRVVDVHALASRMHAGTFAPPGAAYALPYRLFVPDGYDPGRTYPLIVYLHGATGRGVDGLRHLGPEVEALISSPVQSVERSLVLAPQCPPGHEWVERHDRPPFRNYVQASTPESEASRMVLALVEDTAARFHVDRARIYVTGFSMGGSGTWDLVTRHPGTFAAAIPVSGVNDPSRAAAISDLPVWAFHGVDDEVSPVENTRAMVDELRRKGSAVRFTEVPGVGHGAAGHAYGAVETFRWLFAQRRRDVAAAR